MPTKKEQQVAEAPAMRNLFEAPDGNLYPRPYTRQQFRQELLKLMQGNAWRELCEQQHGSAKLLVAAAAGLKA